jgi:hypothetical protein
MVFSRQQTHTATLATQAHRPPASHCRVSRTAGRPASHAHRMNRCLFGPTRATTDEAPADSDPDADAVDEDPQAVGDAARNPDPQPDGDADAEPDADT